MRSLFKLVVLPILLFCCSLNVCLGVIEESLVENNTQTLGDDGLRQGRPSSVVVETVPTYSWEFRSKNEKDIKFTSGGLYQATISETKKSQIICDLKMGVYAHDEDTEVEFNITKGNAEGTFTVSSKRVEDFIFMEITAERKLNREEDGYFLLTVAAQHPETNEVLDMTEVNVNVLDLNDNLPKFSRLFQHVTVEEDIPLHTSVAQVVANDEDMGPNGLLYFSFISKSPFFAIDPISGVVTVTRSLAGKRRRSYGLLVTARDRTLPSSKAQSAKAKHNITVTVRPVNRFSPEIKVKFQLEKIIEGNSDIRFAVIQVSDQDNANSGEINKVRITSGNMEGHFKIRRSQDASDEFWIDVVKPLDREKAPNGYKLVITAFDKGSPPRSGTVTLRVLIEDVNDIKPAFNQSLYEATISELAPLYTSVVRVFVDDGDLGNNAKVYYTLRGGHSKNFRIDRETGLITTTGHLDYETKPVLEFDVWCFQSDSSKQMASARVSVNIEDANDNDPEFENPSYSLEFFEDLRPGTKLPLTVRANDPDSGSNGKIQYSIINRESLPFAIDSETGDIISLTSLDRDAGVPEFITLKIRASDFGEPFRRESETYVHLHIKANNDNQPVFEYFRCTIKISEDAPVGTILTSLTAVDIDVGESEGLVYGIDPVGNTDKTFSINPSTGQLKTAKSLQGGEKEFSLYVTVTDSALKSKHPVTLKIMVVSPQTATEFLNYVETRCSVFPHYLKAVEHVRKQGNFKPSYPSIEKVPAKPTNRNYPRFHLHKSVIEVSEDVAVKSTIMKFSATDDDQGYNGMILYSIVSGNIGSAFNIDMHTGELYIASLLDRETMGKFRLNISANDCGSPGKTAHTVIYINVIDVNDNAPVFERDIYEVSKPENITRGQTVVVVNATDMDDGENGRIHFKLLNDFGEKFRIDSRTGRLSVAYALDYEDRAKYSIEVQAFDNSPTSQRMVSAMVIVNLVDINDNAPAIVPRTFNVSIPEDLPPESVVAAISAEDPDTGLGGELEFSFVDNLKRFKIDSGSGVIRLRRHVDYEQENVYNLKVKISDKGTPRLSSFANVNINILDVNENNIAPIFPGVSLLRATVSENSPVGTSVLKAEAFDSDSWYMSYFIIDGTGVDKFEIGRENGIIRTTKMLDCEESDHYWLHIQVKDREMSPLHTNIPMLITVLPVNDDPPYFNPAIYFPSVIENAAPGESVVTVKAHNPSSDGSNLLYSIKSGNEAGRFAIDRKSGLITTTTSLDREEQDKYELEVKVSNGDNPPKSAYITFPVTVADANDNGPYFLKSFYDVYFKQQDDPSTSVEILRVAAVDKDISSNADLTYGFLYPSEISPGLLKIDPKTGVISAKLSCQGEDYLEFEVNVTDSGVPPRSAIVPVFMEYCMSKNPPSSNPPRFRQKVYKKSFKEDAEVGSVVELVSAHDSDGDSLTYSIISGNIGNKFLIDKARGEVTIANKLDHEEASSYTLTIQASDDYNAKTTSLEIEVEDVNDNSPVPLMTEYQVHIPEDAKIGSVLTKVEATDGDGGASGSVKYAIVGSVKQKSISLFMIQSLTGNIKTTKPLDYEDLKEHTLIIEATDQATPKRQSLFTIVIKVDDVNDHKPMFVRSEFKAEVNVDASIGTPIIKVFATDDDDGTNALLKFSIKGGNTNDAFYIDQNSGIIQVAAKLSSAIDEYSLQVQVSDSGIPTQTAEVEVKILVRGINQPVEFERPLYQASIKENHRPGHPIINVIFNGSLPSYEFVPQDNACWKDFDINRKTGLVTNKKPFDAEELTECKFLIRGTSSDGNGQTQLIVKIIDENDHAPAFSQLLYLGHIKEGLPEDSPVIGGDGKALAIQASDADVSGSDLMYEVVGCSMFTIDSQSGELMTAEMLDFESVSSYRFKIKVSDDGTPSFSAFTDVVVSVHDVNDLPPIFSSPVFEAVVFLPTYSGSVITTVTAADGDSQPLTSLTYSIATPSLTHIFDISPRQGVITVKNSSLIHQAVYHVQVSVSDGNFSNQATVNIECKPLPVSDLQFSQMEYNASVVEGISTAADIVQLQTVGYSIGDTITYSVVVPSHFFVISESTGIVSTLPGKTFDRETTDRYEIVVQARDDRKPMPRVAQSLLYVIVDDVNDNAPIFTKDVYFFVIQVSADVGAFVGQVQASDKDIGSNGAIKYFLKGGGEGRFEVRYATGNIEVSRLLDGIIVPSVFTLEIEARDEGVVRMSAKTIVKIKVVDKETPIFDYLSYSKVVREDVNVGEEITRVQARSPGGADILYTILAGDPYNQFAIDLKTGVLTVESSLDYEVRTSYQLLVRATDESTTSYGEITVLITITDVNDIAPLFNQSLYLATIPEDTPTGTSVVSFTAFDRDSGVNKQLSYRLETLNSHNDSKTSEFFVISQATSQIVVAKRLDYEQNIVHELKLIVTDGGTPPLTGEARVRIVVEDANDNPPSFEQNSYATSISGSAGPGFFVTRVIASDPDDDDVGKLRYLIKSGHGKEYFEIDSTSGVLTISKHVGFERGKVYDLSVEVTDGKSSAVTSVRVVIGDTNDHSPVFDQEVYPVDFYENYPPGTFVTMVTATDLDSGDYARVRYSIDDVDAAEKFMIDGETGMIYSKISFDRENSSEAFSSIPVRASDGGGRFGFCTVQVNVLDENDNQPKFELPLYEVTIHSSTPVGTSILMTSANDADTGSNGALSYVILGHQTPPVFEVEKDSGFIKISRQPETKTYMFHVLVKDGGFPYLRNTVKVSVNVLRKNAKILQFEKSVYRILVPEDLNTDGIITTLRTLLPGSTRPRVGFQIIPGNSPSSKGDHFSIDASGQIKLKRRLDYETLKRYVLVIEANSSEISQVARTVVIVSVTDVNDNKPHFVANPYRVSIPENMMVKSKVLRVFAEDLDDFQNGKILYDFGTKTNLFAIDQHTGWITTAAPIDREVANSLVLRVRATDKGEVTQLSGYTVVEVTVLDVNDSPPQFTEDIFTFSVREDALIGQEVGTLTSFDNDTNSDVYFFIMSGDPQTKFGIEQKTGKVFVHSPLDRESVSSYKLNVSCSDGLFTSFTTLIITVLDANDNVPVCTQSISIVHLSEDVKPGTEVMIVEATDADADDNGKLRYSVFGQGMGFFGVENGTGRLVTAKLLDREVQEMYNFMVSAEDRGGQACFSNITVLLDDVNDNGPVFSQSEYRKAVYEDARRNKVLLQVRADDSDLGKNRKISYSLLDTAGDTFSVDSETGVITLTSDLNREKQAEYVLTVQAEDAGVPPQSETCNVVIQVLNINDVPPEFDKSSYKANVSEDAAKGTKITKMKAISREAGHEEFSYEILKGPDSDIFKIDKKTGDVTLEGNLDFETRKSYSLTIQASDVGPPVLTTTCSLSVLVTDANDHVPKFGQDLYTARVDENSDLDSFVLQMFATDLDSGSNRDIRYSIVKGNDADKFKIDDITGVISIKAHVDHESVSQYALTVRAQDKGIPPLSAETQVELSINDLNDNPPEFTNTNFTVSVSELAAIGTTVIFLRPHDRDGPGNKGPFTFMKIKGDETKFKLERDGLITKAGPLDHRDKEHKFEIRVFDSGEPPMYTDKTLTIIVVEGISHPPVVEPLTVYLKLYSSQFNGGVIGSVKGTDADGDPLTYSIVAPRSGSPFTITNSGVISATSNVPSRIYNLNASVSDGKYLTYVPVKIVVSDITEDILRHSLTLRLSALSPGTFVERNLGKCRDYLGFLLNVPAENVHIWSLQSSDTSLDVVFAVMKRVKGFYASQHIAHKLNSSRGDFQRVVGVQVGYIGVSQCPLMHCPENYSCQTVYKPQNKQIRIMSERTTYTSYEHSRSHACMCNRDAGCASGKCASNPCPAGYECADFPLGFQCKCVDSSKCQPDKPGCEDQSCIIGNNAISFGGDSYIRYKLKQSFDEPSRSISLALKTTEPRGTLVWAAGQYDYSILEIVNGRLQLRFDFGSGAGVVNLDWARVDDGKWHHVAIMRQGNHATLILDQGRHRAWNKSPGKMRILNLDDNAIYFGAKVVKSKSRRDLNNRGHLVEDGFKGCLQNLNLNNQDLPMSGSNSYVAAEPFNAVPGCQLSGGCRINTCPRDSTCIETLTSKKCECLPGHSGSDCRAFWDCGFKPCQNGGTCVPHPTDRYQCRCKDGYSGTQCHIYTGHCASAPCRNGGSCIPSGESGFICTCPAGVQGKTCEQDTRPCSSNPCANNANCTNHGESYKCHCRAGFSGEICDEGYRCSKDSHCQNGGTCQENQKNSAAVCRCLQGYTGADCSEDVDECASSPCKNGGVCVNQLGNFACNCSASSHGGKLCELVLTSIEARRGWPLGQTEIIGIAVVLAVILLIVFLVVIFLRRRAKRRREKREQAGAVSTSVLKVSPPVVGSEVTSPEPPTPPPREVHGYNVDDLGMPPGYDAEDSWRRREKVRKDFGTMKTLTSLSDNNLPGYQWDYTDIPADLVPRTPLSKEHSGSYSGSPDCATFAPEVPQRPSSFRSSQGSLDVPEVPKRPRNYRVSESEDGYTDVPHVPKKPMEYTNPKGKSASRYSMDSRFSEFSDATDLDPDIFKGRFPRPPREPYPESLDQLPVGSYAPTLTARGSELGSVTDGMYSEDDLEQVYLGNRMEVCDDSPENSYLHSENCSEDEDDDYHRDRYARAATPDPEFHKELQREIKEMMNELEELKLESEI